jgi:hypothetical protein
MHLGTVTISKFRLPFQARVLQRLGMTKVPRTVLFAASAVVAIGLTSRASAQAAPNRAHPRIWLDSATRQGIQAQAGVAGSPVARASARCSAAHDDPSEYATGGWQGFEFVTTLAACLTSWVATNGENDLATAIKYFNVLLDDYQQVGDGLGGDDVVTHDTGYAMRTFAPYSALAYDWLHDAPGVTEELRAHARARFHAWSTYYSTKGYLRDVPGANYQAGYAFAATLMAIAEAGEAGEAGEAHWANVRDVIWARDLAPSFATGGVLEGGDWPEGWQYGSLSVLEHSLAARAMQENGAPVANASAWASSLPVRFAHGLTPHARQAFVGGDSDAATPYRKPDNGALLAAIAGPASDEAKAWARQLNSQLDLQNENPLFDALALAAAGTSAALPAEASTNYLARGAGNWYVRGAWAAETAWAVFQCAPRLVDDHQYANAGNWVLTRGADDLVVDPSPYGSLSTLTGNAPAIDSGSLPEGYSPSQGYWGEKSGLVWARQSGSGIAAARCDYADQFQRSDVPSDVSHALRDFVMIPDDAGAAIVLIDRATTGGAERNLHLRVRTPSSLSLSGDVASATLGGSSLAVRKVWASSGTPSVRAMPQASECPSSSHTCDVSKLAAGTEYRIDVSGPSAAAIHVVNAAAPGVEAPGQLLTGSGYRGVLVKRGATQVAVVTSDAAAPVGAAFSYRVPAAANVVHVVVDAPTDAAGTSDVSAVLDGSDCKVEVKAHSGATPGLEGRPLVVRLQADCSLRDDGTKAPLEPDPSGPGMAGTPGSAGGSNPGAPNGAGGSSGTSTPGDGGMLAATTGRNSGASGCGVTRSRARRVPAWALGLLGLSLARRRRRHPRRA